MGYKRLEDEMSLEIQLRDIAKARGIPSAKQLSEKADVPYATVTRYWQGGDMERVSLPVLAALAKAIGVKAMDLLVETDD